MVLKPGREIEGFAAKAVRDALRSIPEQSMRANFFEGWVDDRPVELLALCERQGFLVPSPDGNAWALTELGRRMGQARFGKVLSRTRADQLYLEFMARVADVNADTDSPSFVSKVVLYGSYMDSAKEEVGDIDLAVEVKTRPGFGHPNPGAVADALCEAKGLRYPGSWLGVLFLPDYYVTRYIKGRRSEISLCYPDSLARLNCPQEVVFEVGLNDVAPCTLHIDE